MKHILIICLNELRCRRAMQRAFEKLGGKATCKVTSGIIETADETYHFRAPYKERLVGMEVQEIMFDEDVLPEDKDMVRAYVRIKK